MNIWVHMIVAVIALSARAQLPPLSADILPASASITGTVVRAADEASARAGLSVVTQLHARICEMLCVTTAPPQSVAWFTDATAWKNYIGSSGAHIKGKGVSALGAIAVLADAGDEHEPLAHELVHQVLKGTSKAPLPLWFEEGCAACFGWMAAKELAMRSNHAVARILPVMEEGMLLPSAQLLGSGDYPQTPEANRAFYRQAEEMVRLLMERSDGPGFRKLTVELAKENDLKICLMKSFDYSETAWRNLVSSMVARCIVKQQR